LSFEFETPAIIIGRSGDEAELPPQHREGYLDLHSGGFDRLEAAGSTGLDLSLFARLVAGRDTLGLLSEIELTLETWSGQAVRLALQRDAGQGKHDLNLFIKEPA